MSSPFGNSGSPSSSGGNSFTAPASGSSPFSQTNSGLGSEHNSFGGTAVSPQSSPAKAVKATSTSWLYCGIGLAAAVLGVVLALAALLFGGSATDSSFRTLAIVAWVLSGIFAFILVGLHKLSENKCRDAGAYYEKYSQVIAVKATLTLGVIGVLISAVEIALWVSKTVGA